MSFFLINIKLQKELALQVRTSAIMLLRWYQQVLKFYFEAWNLHFYQLPCLQPDLAILDMKEKLTGFS